MVFCEFQLFICFPSVNISKTGATWPSHTLVSAGDCASVAIVLIFIASIWGVWNHRSGGLGCHSGSWLPHQRTNSRTRAWNPCLMCGCLSTVKFVQCACYRSDVSYELKQKLVTILSAVGGIITSTSLTALSLAEWINLHKINGLPHGVVALLNTEEADLGKGSVQA